MDKIIDVHCHLGDVLYPNGGSLIEKRGVKKKFVLDIVSLSEITLHKYAYTGDVHSGLVNKLDIKSGIARSSAATLENFQKSMERAGISACACMPIPPNVTFADLLPAAKKDPRIIPFTGVDYTKTYDIEAALAADVASGAKGLKLHPILQCIKLTDKKVFDTVEAFAPHRLPILMHTGIADYYFKDQ